MQPQPRMIVFNVRIRWLPKFVIFYVDNIVRFQTFSLTYGSVEFLPKPTDSKAPTAEKIRPRTLFQALTSFSSCSTRTIANCCTGDSSPSTQASLSSPTRRVMHFFVVQLF